MPSTKESLALNDRGDVLYQIKADADPFTDSAILLNGRTVAREGDAAPLSGRVYAWGIRSST